MASSAAPSAEPSAQLDLLSWRPKAAPAPVAPAAPSTGKRLDATDRPLSLLSGIDLDPTPPKK